MVSINRDCTGCGLCLATCPEGALRRGPKLPVALHDRCSACLACVEVCPVDAIAVEQAPGPP
jgi:NAD-dependent dihydropyrimidine dehydrogenase PreA subunit